MLPILPLALALAPELAKFLFGGQAAATTKAVTDLVQTVTGTADPEAARTVLAHDPTLSDAVRVGLARIAAQADQDSRTSDLEALRAGLAEIAQARAQTQGLVKAGSQVALGAPLVSVAILASFALVIWLAMTRVLPVGAETMVNLLLGSLSAMASSVVAYWVGSSAGSAVKTDLLFRSQPAVAPAATI
jgi:hypothetical protein